MYPSTRRNYTDEFKTQAVALAESVGRTEAARQLKCPSKRSITGWTPRAGAHHLANLSCEAHIVGY